MFGSTWTVLRQDSNRDKPPPAVDLLTCGTSGHPPNSDIHTHTHPARCTLFFFEQLNDGIKSQACCYFKSFTRTLIQTAAKNVLSSVSLSVSCDCPHLDHSINKLAKKEEDSYFEHPVNRFISDESRQVRNQGDRIRGSNTHSALISASFQPPLT